MNRKQINTKLLPKQLRSYRLFRLHPREESLIHNETEGISREIDIWAQSLQMS